MPPPIFENKHEQDGFTMKLWRGERLCMLGFDVQDPEPDFVGFAIECKAPGAANFQRLRNRIHFDYVNRPALVDGYRNYPSTEAPFQKFRWMHFPYDPQPGTYTYRATRMHMPQDGPLVAGTSITLDIPMDPITYQGFCDVGFTRNFSSSQAFNDRFKTALNGAPVIPGTADEGLDFNAPAIPELYPWLGFESHSLLMGLLDEAVADAALTLDVFAYDLNLRPMVEKLEQMAGRVRIIIDDSVGDGGSGHGHANSAETAAAARLEDAGAQVRRTHFAGLQHHKTILVRRDGTPERVLIGSTNFSWRGLYIQANNLIIFSNAEIADLYAQVFERVFTNPASFHTDPLAKKWHVVQTPGLPPVHICFSPHSDPKLSLNPVGGAIDLARSSVFYSVAFLYQTRGGEVKTALDRVMGRPIFSYGISDKGGSLEMMKSDGSRGLVSFAYLKDHAPAPFSLEWSGGPGINQHHKFVVTDFNLPTAKVFTGSSNLSPSGEKGNGDHLIMIEDRQIATAYALEALRSFDHLEFRIRMSEEEAAGNPTTEITLRKPKAISGKDPWWKPYYKPNTQRSRDREIFSS